MPTGNRSGPKTRAATMPKQTPPAYAIGSPAGVELIRRKTTIGAGGWEKEETNDAETGIRGGGRLYRHAKPQPLQYRLISFSTLVQPAE